MDLGTASAGPGETATGYLEAAQLPTGVTERLPVVIARGETPGPELWITATIHGDEANGLAVAQDVMTADLHERLTGTVVCLPNLNPAGLRRNERRPYYGDDPNRRFPAPDDEDDDPPTVVETMYRRVFDAFAPSADALIDLHTANISSVPFNIRHRVLYGEHRDEAAARDLADEQERLMSAFGLPIVNQYDDYLDRSLHRTATGAALNNAGIPAMTVELGQHSVINDRTVNAGVAGCYRVMTAMGMLETVPDAVAAADPDIADPVGYPVKRADGPYAPTAGIVRHRIEPGGTFEAGEPVADIVTSHGTHEATVTASRDGYLIYRSTGAAVYEHDEIASIVVRDDGDVVIPREDGPDSS